MGWSIDTTIERKILVLCKRIVNFRHIFVVGGQLIINQRPRDTKRLQNPIDMELIVCKIHDFNRENETEFLQKFIQVSTLLKFNHSNISIVRFVEIEVIKS